MVLIFPNLCLWRRSLRSNVGGIHAKKLYRATLMVGNLQPRSLVDEVEEINKRSGYETSQLAIAKGDCRTPVWL